MGHHVVIVGGGIAGLATAWFLRHGAEGLPGSTELDVTLVESDSRLGGKLRTEAFAGTTVDVGADAFLARRPEGLALAEATGRGSDLVTPATSDVRLWIGDRLASLPSGTVLGVPTSLTALLRSGAVTPWQAARAGLDLVLPREPRLRDRSLGDLVAERFGAGIVDRLIDPLLGGVYAGDPHQLSVTATAPTIAEAARTSRSILVGLRRARRGTDPDAPIFATLRGGMSSIIAPLVADDVEVRSPDPVRSIERRDGRYVLGLAGGDELVADAVVLATPSFVTGGLLNGLAPEAGDGLRSIRYASVATISLAYRRSDLTSVPAGSGVLVPSDQGRLVKAVTNQSAKWPHLAGLDHVLLRASVGRIDDQRALGLDDPDLVAAVTQEVAAMYGLDAAPADTLVTRWERALPQYEVGHLDRVAAIEASLPPGVQVAGAAYHGIGVAPCIGSAERAAARVLSRS